MDGIIISVFSHKIQSNENQDRLSLVHLQTKNPDSWLTNLHDEIHRTILVLVRHNVEGHNPTSSRSAMRLLNFFRKTQPDGPFYDGAQ